MKCFAICLTFGAVCLMSESAIANHPPAGFGEVTGHYDLTTGEIEVSVNNVVNWYVEDVGSQSMTGDEPVGMPGGAGLVTNNDTRIGESAFVPFSYDLNLGNVAAANLSAVNMRVFWNEELGGVLQSNPIAGPLTLPDRPPTAVIDGPILVDRSIDPLNILLDASDSIIYDTYGIWGPLTYTWDLDNNGSFEVDTGTDGTLAIADVTATFGGIGTYGVNVRVFDGWYADVASTTVVIVPEPGAAVLFGLGVIGFVVVRRHRPGKVF